MGRAVHNMKEKRCKTVREPKTEKYARCIILKIRTLSRIYERGQAMGESSSIAPRMIQIVFAPKSRPCREHSACGMISAKMTMRAVDRMRPVAWHAQSQRRCAKGFLHAVTPAIAVTSAKQGYKLHVKDLQSTPTVSSAYHLDK